MIFNIQLNGLQTNGTYFNKGNSNIEKPIFRQIYIQKVLKKPALKAIFY